MNRTLPREARARIRDTETSTPPPVGQRTAGSSLRESARDWNGLPTADRRQVVGEVKRGNLYVEQGQTFRFLIVGAGSPPAP